MYLETYIIKNKLNNSDAYMMKHARTKLGLFTNYLIRGEIQKIMNDGFVVVFENDLAHLLIIDKSHIVQREIGITTRSKIMYYENYYYKPVKFPRIII